MIFLTVSAAAAIPWGSEAADGQGIGLAGASMLAAAAKPALAAAPNPSPCPSPNPSHNPSHDPNPNPNQALAACLGRDMRRDGLTPLVLVWWDSLFAMVGYPHPYPYPYP